MLNFITPASTNLDHKVRLVNCFLYTRSLGSGKLVFFTPKKAQKGTRLLFNYVSENTVTGDVNGNRDVSLLRK